MGKSDLLTYFLEFNMISEILVLVTISNRIFYWTIISVLRKYVRGIRKFGAKHFWGQSDNISQECSGRRQNHSLAETRSNLSHSSAEYNEFSNCVTFKGNPPIEHIFTPRMQHDKTGLLDLWLIDLWHQNKQTCSFFITIESEMGNFAIICTALLFGRRMNRKSLQLIKSALCYHGIPGSILLNSFFFFLGQGGDAFVSV